MSFTKKWELFRGLSATSSGSLVSPQFRPGKRQAPPTTSAVEGRRCQQCRHPRALSESGFGNINPIPFRREAGRYYWKLFSSFRYGSGAFREDFRPRLRTDWPVLDRRSSKVSFEYLLLPPRSAPAVGSTRARTLGFHARRGTLLLVTVSFCPRKWDVWDSRWRWDTNG